MHNVSHLIASVVRVFDSFSKCFFQTHLLTTAINNQTNSILSRLQSIVYKVHPLSTDLNRKFVQRSVNGI